MPAVLSTVEDLVTQEQKIVLEAFKRYDLDGNGMIDRQELADVLFSVSTLTPADVDGLLVDIDLNKDGLIDIKEFTRWLVDPETNHRLGGDGWITNHDLGMLMEPLFSVWDRNQDGTISQEEFRECCLIMSNSMNLYSQKASRTDQLNRSVTAEWKMADDSCDGKVDFKEFLGWQSKYLKKSGIPNSVLPGLLEELTSSLHTVFDIETLVGAENSNLELTKALTNTVDKLARLSQRLYTAKSDLVLNTPKATSMPSPGLETELYSDWCPPPPNAAALLIRTCAKELGVMLHGGSSAGASPSVSSRDKISRDVGKLIYIIPEANSRKPGNRWLAKVQGRDNYINYFELSASRARWEKYTGDEAEFDSAWQALEPTVRLFALLDAQVLAGKTLSWSAVESALRLGEKMGLIEDGAVRALADDLRQEIVSEIKAAQGQHELKDMGKPIQEAVEEYLHALQLSPSDVLADLHELGLLEASASIWVQILPSEID